MRMTIDVEIEDFRIPNFLVPAHNTEADKQATNTTPSIPLKAASQQMLSDLCDNFRKGVFQKAGMPDPQIFK